MALPLELDGVRLRAARDAAWDALEPLGLAERSGRYPDELSGGERQRVAIARAVVGDRRLLLADEPTGALDSVNGEDVMRLLRRACERGVAGVIVTHDAQLAAWADRVVFLRDGRTVDQTGSPSRTRVAARARGPAVTSAPPLEATPAPRGRIPGARDRRRAPGAPAVVAGPGGCSAASGASSCSWWRCSRWPSPPRWAGRRRSTARSRPWTAISAPPTAAST